MDHYIAVDVGGTQMRAACFQPDNHEPERLSKISTQHLGESPLQRLIDLITDVWPESGSVLALAVAVPGPLDPYRGVLMAAPNIPGWVDFPLQEMLQSRFDTKVMLGNDANLAALGEWKFGIGLGHHNLIYLTISTGIGGGIIVQDQLLLGAHGLAAEVGHTTVMLDGPLCGCGKHGHLEAVASGTAIAHWVEQELAKGVASSLPTHQSLSARQIAIAAQQGDALAIAAMGRAGMFIGQAIADLLHLFNPSIIIIGGGVSQSGPLLLEPMQRSLREHVITAHYLDGLTITTTVLGDEAGLLGALALAQSVSTASISSQATLR